MLWLISDTHWGHKNIIEYSKRPFSSIEDMDEALIKNWNALVQPNDDVWHLGDFAFMKYMQFTTVLRRLNGKINVVLGNHDKVIIENKKDLLTSNLLNSIQDYKEVKYEGKNLILFHFPIKSWNKKHHGAIHCFGHVHSAIPAFAKSVDVGVDNKEITSEYRPISFDELVKFMDKRPDVIVDHHVSKD